MTHIVIGYPSFDASLEIVDAMVEAGVDLMELQLPFSEPIADGPVILRANQEALRRGITVDRCFEFTSRVTQRHPIPFLFMTYFNLLHRRKTAVFTEQMAKVGLQGSIVPDLPPEEGSEYLSLMSQHKLDPIFIFSPNTSEERLAYLSRFAKGFVYCVARKGVTGAATTFDTNLDEYLARCRRATSLPLALGFGVRSAEEIRYLRDRVEIAVVGSETLRRVDTQGISAVKPFIEELRAATL